MTARIPGPEERFVPQTEMARNLCQVVARKHKIAEHQVTHAMVNAFMVPYERAARRYEELREQDRKRKKP